MDKVIESVLSYPKLLERLKNKEEDKKKVLANVAEIRGDFSPTVVRTIAKMIDFSFKNLYDGMNFEVPPGVDLKKLKQDYNVILVPNHQSHADYIAMTYLLFTHYELPLYVAGGINLNIFPVGQIFRKSGCFFIRRKFNSDILYKFSFEGYIYHLLKEGEIIEFFFEGGRSRTGKLLPPRFGLFQMLIEAHQQIPNAKPMMFIPVSIAHEQVPEQRAHAKELKGAKKEAEHSTQLFKLVKLFNKRFGTIHVRLGNGIICDSKTIADTKTYTRDLAFECFRQVGKGMPVTPVSLLALILLDEASGALTWAMIEDHAFEVIKFCQRFYIPVSKSLTGDLASEKLKHALDILINNKKIQVIHKEKLNLTFYSIVPSARVEVLYFKNMILHHFIVPCFMNSAWFNVFNGRIKSANGLTKFLMLQRKELKYEFYLPHTREMIGEAIEIINHSVGRQIENLAECFTFTPNELFKIATTVKRFASTFCHIYESYYIACSSLKYLGTEQFSTDRYLQVSREIFEMERVHGRMVKYSESYTVPNMKNTLEYFVKMEVLDRTLGKYRVNDMKKVDALMERFTQELNDLVSINVKFSANKTNEH